ncbi:MAG: hypothetical protein IPK04_14465 [Bdellovibrionales bacterium]|nr:hypothetical protein [Bdellovibrionales bacterium]
MFRQICLTIFLLSGFASVGLAGQGHSMDQIDTCFHWLETNQLLAKIEYARKYDGAFYFHQRQPVYCWKSPLGAYSAWERHGNELLRIKLKPGIRVVERYRGKSIDDMIDTPVIYSKEREWHEYIITPEAIESWSIYHPNMVNEMKAELAYYGTFTKKPNPNDVFYPIEQYDFSFLTSVIPNIIEKHSQAAQEGRSEIFGKNQEDHFKTKFRLPWQNMFQVKQK